MYRRLGIGGRVQDIDDSADSFTNGKCRSISFSRRSFQFTDNSMSHSDSVLRGSLPQVSFSETRPTLTYSTWSLSSGCRRDGKSARRSFGGEDIIMIKSKPLRSIISLEVDDNRSERHNHSLDSDFRTRTHKVHPC